MIKIGTTINDIAKAANVSPSTVSRVIANSSLISEATRKRVREIMKEMNYHPNMIARSLVNKSTKIIGTLIPGTSEKAFEHPFYPEILRGITARANQHGYNILLSNAGSAEQETHVINEMVNGGIIEGLILMTSRLNDKSIKKLVAMDFPFVMVGRPDINDKNIFWVDNDNFNACYNLTKYFIEKGHRKIAFIGVTPEYMVAIDRLNGYKKALAEYDIDFNEKIIVNSEFMNGDGYEMTNELFNRNQQFTGLIAADDFQAYAAIHLMIERGLKVPEDIAVAGFNNVIMSEYNIPSLTSIEVHAFDLGGKAFELLYGRLKNEKSMKYNDYVKAEIIKRKSC